MSQVDNYLKLIVRAPQTDDDRKACRLGRMITHEIFPFGPNDPEVILVLKSLAGIVADETARGNDASLSSFGPLLFPTAFKVDRVGRLDFHRSKMYLPPSQLQDRHKKAN